MEFGIIRSALSPSGVASIVHHQNRTFCPKLRITKKKNHTSNQESFRKSVFKTEKQKTVFLTVQS